MTCLQRNLNDGRTCSRFSAVACHPSVHLVRDGSRSWRMWSLHEHPNHALIRLFMRSRAGSKTRLTGENFLTADGNDGIPLPHALPLQQPSLWIGHSRGSSLGRVDRGPEAGLEWIFGC